MRDYIEILKDLKDRITPEANSYLEELISKFQEDLDNISKTLKK